MYSKSYWKLHFHSRFHVVLLNQTNYSFVFFIFLLQLLILHLFLSRNSLIFKIVPIYASTFSVSFSLSLKKKRKKEEKTRKRTVIQCYWSESRIMLYYSVSGCAGGWTCVLKVSLFWCTNACWTLSLLEWKARLRFIQWIAKAVYLPVTPGCPPPCLPCSRERGHCCKLAVWKPLML